MSIIDLKESYEGDLIIEGNDIADTSINTDLTFHQLMRSVVATIVGDHLIWPYFGFNTDSYIGKPNTRQLGNTIAKAMQTAISSSTGIPYSVLDVKPFPVGHNTIAFRIIIRNLTGPIEQYLVTYDTQDNMVRSLVLDTESTDPATIFVDIPPTK